MNQCGDNRRINTTAQGTKNFSLTDYRPYIIDFSSDKVFNCPIALTFANIKDKPFYNVAAVFRINFRMDMNTIQCLIYISYIYKQYQYSHYIKLHLCHVPDSSQYH